MFALKNFGKEVWLFFKKLKGKIWVFLKSLKNLKLVIEKEKMEVPEDSFSRNSIMSRIILEDCENPDMVNIHFPIEISESQIESFYRPLRESSEPYLQQTGRRGRKIVKSLLAIRGIVEVFIKPYELSIIKGKCFSWDEEIMPKAKKAIRKAL